MSALRPLSVIVAMDARRVIGRNNGIPWHHSEDLKHFRRTTLGHALVMGRATFESIGKPLPKRHTIVVTRNPTYDAPGCQVAHDLPSALALAYALDPAPVVAGGAQIYAEAMPLVTQLYLTIVPGEHDGDAFFPAFDANAFAETERREQDGLTFLTLARTRPG